MKDGVGGGDQSLVPAATGGTPPLPLPAGATVRYFPLHHQPPFTPYMSNGAFCLDLNNNNRHQQQQQQHHRQFSNPLLENLTISPPSKPFTSLLTGFDDQDATPPIVRDHNAQIDQLIRNQGEHFKCVLAEMQRRQYDAVVHEAEEKAAKKVKEKELELNQVARKILGYEHREALFQKENQLLQSKLKYLEDTNASLRAALQEALLRGGKAEETGGSSEVQQDEAESSHVGRHRLAEEVEPIKLACRACGKRVATVMTWPCRHVSTCTRCDETTKACPVCGSIKTTSVEVRLP
ncbi:probable BOI-related E3 ubiquitin-protein ligase 3 [Coffea arabica]|uniref:Probable BOI-related E3 ubiquitin-protein ligase 3 n=1 Tax=Coffea arabica TaxID=13443 RepID=A0ABM4X0S3_COFAR